MPVYDFLCEACETTKEFRAGPDHTTLVCPCGGVMRRKFNTRVQIRIPSEFHAQRGWYLPPKDSPKWENMVAEGSEKSQVKETSFKEFVESEG